MCNDDIFVKYAPRLKIRPNCKRLQNILKASCRNLPKEMSPLLSMDSLMVLGMLTSDTLDVCFFFFGLSPYPYLEEDRERCRRPAGVAEDAMVDSLTRDWRSACGVRHLAVAHSLTDWRRDASPLPGRHRADAATGDLGPRNLPTTFCRVFGPFTHLRETGSATRLTGFYCLTSFNPVYAPICWNVYSVVV